MDETGEARERFRVEMLKYGKQVERLASADPETLDVAPHLIGRG